MFLYCKMHSTECLIFSGYHGDNLPFDGPGGNLGHTFLPGTSKDGDIHMDTEEKWTEMFLYNVAVHEIGHSLGLGHSSYYNSVMYNAYTRTNRITGLHKDDQEGLRKIYGKEYNLNLASLIKPCKINQPSLSFNLSHSRLFIQRQDSESLPEKGKISAGESNSRLF